MTDTKGIARVFKALSDETRLRIVQMLAMMGPDGALCAGCAASALGVSQSAISQHLAMLRSVNLVIDERRGYFVHYRLNWWELVRQGERVRAVLGHDFACALAGEKPPAKLPS